MAATGNNVYADFVEKFVKPIVDASNTLGGKFVALVLHTFGGITCRVK